MSPKRGDRVAPPASHHEWELRFATTEATKGWDQLCQQAAGNTRQAWSELRTQPGPVPGTPGTINLLDNEKRTVWIKVAGTGHPSATD